ncbi:MAG: hypothetical protein HY053_08840 [Proteobacteria bacterium]|nr:hypothetical protein [Pseudomonadota bacterium]
MSTEFIVTIEAVTQSGSSSATKKPRPIRGVRPSVSSTRTTRQGTWEIKVVISSQLTAPERRDIRAEIFYEFDQSPGRFTLLNGKHAGTRWPLQVTCAPVRDKNATYETIISGEFIPQNAAARMAVYDIHLGILYRLQEMGYKAATP